LKPWLWNEADGLIVFLHQVSNVVEHRCLLRSSLNGSNNVLFAHRLEAFKRRSIRSRMAVPGVPFSTFDDDLDVEV
jgi:hypothetical protein